MTAGNTQTVNHNHNILTIKQVFIAKDDEDVKQCL